MAHEILGSSLVPVFDRDRGTHRPPDARDRLREEDLPTSKAARKAERNAARKPRKSRTLARDADRYALYLQSVQAPDVDVGFFQRIYKAAYGRRARVLREDFCGTAAVCCEWARTFDDGEAYGVDIDPDPLGWGRVHNVSRLNSEQANRVHLVEGDVRTAATPPVDIVAAQNFSYMIFKTRDGLRDYFRVAREHLAPEGALILDLYGGYEAFEDGREEVTEHEGFDYVWEQAKFDPITHDALCHIHFRFPDGSELREAFSYHWRLWTLPEIREIVREAGFARAEVYWEDADRESGEGSGIYRRRERGEADPAWNAYIIGIK